jgi:hypothetical protein
MASDTERPTTFAPFRACRAIASPRRIFCGQKKSGAAAPHSKISVLSVQSVVKLWRLTQNALQSASLLRAQFDQGDILRDLLIHVISAIYG